MADVKIDTADIKVQNGTPTTPRTVDPMFGVDVKPAKPNLKLTGGMTPSKDAQSLYVDPTSAYKPVLDFLAQQETAARARYGENKSDIKTIFGALTDVAVQDQARINEQFTQSIAEQQMSLAARTAEARQGAAAGVAASQAAGAERGNGPAMGVNPLQTASDEGIARSNAYQTTWEALQNANKDQAVVNTQTRQAGYGQQQVGAIQQLARNLEDRLMEIGGNTAQVQADIAKAQIGAKQTVANANYQERQTSKQQAAANYRAQLAAQAKANKPKTYPRTLAGLTSYISDIAPSEKDATNFMNSLAKAETDAIADDRSSGQAYQMWLAKHKSYPQEYKTKAKEYFNYYYKK
jgi:hypothetical protein